jgi:Cu/Ag efflux pump CusA
MRFLQRLYRPLLAWALDHRMITLAGALVLFGGPVVLAVSGVGG